MSVFPAHPTPQAIHRAYNSGYPFWRFDASDERELEAVYASGPPVYFGDVCPHLAGAGEAKRALLYRSREKYDPGAFSQEPQTTGDCVSHGDRNARDTTRSVEIDIHRQPEEYFRRGATEPTYGARGWTGEGMDPATATRFVREVGWLMRENYGVVDLSRYDSQIGTSWGGRGVPQEVKDLCRKYRVGRDVVPRSAAEARDLLASGYAGHSGQTWGTPARTKADGLNRRSTGWNHDMATVGMDWTRELWSVEVFFVQNSWGAWNEPNPVWKQHEEILGPWIPGMIVVPVDEYDRYFVRSGSISYYADIVGVPRKPLPDWGSSWMTEA